MLEQVETLVIHSGSTSTPNYPIFIMFAIIAIIVTISYVIRQELDKKRIQILQQYKIELEQKKIAKKRASSGGYQKFTR